MNCVLFSSVFAAVSLFAQVFNTIVCIFYTRTYVYFYVSHFVCITAEIDRMLCTHCESPKKKSTTHNHTSTHIRAAFTISRRSHYCLCACVRHLNKLKKQYTDLKYLCGSPMAVRLIQIEFNQSV